MSEYWVSKKKYFCKYCDIYIADDAPSRQQHENGLRHKGNTERFIRSIYKAGEKKKKDDEEERREMARVEQAAQIAFAQDVGAGRAKLSGSSSAPPPVPVSARNPPPKPSNPYTNYSTAKSLGYDDPDAERLAAEAERRRMQGVAGDWQMVVPSTPSTFDAAPSSDSLKRPAEVDEDDSREFKLMKKTMGTGLGQIYDPGTISIKLKKKEEPTEAGDLVTPSTPSASDPTDKPKWAKLQWKKSGDDDEHSDATSTQHAIKAEFETGASLLAKIEEDPTPDSVVPGGDAETAVKLGLDVSQMGETADTSKAIFKKRKTPAGGARGRRQDP
ncbi:hypothetical protein B0H10DRAFT_1812627 [Mycena sp. CBHHK59/15]|nr:hypothetical protein B0H10DRAFT_1812627 [Mycena sp. CBHHK59/15]